MTTAINIAAMEAGIAAAIIAAGKSKFTGADAVNIEKSVSELKGKFDGYLRVAVISDLSS